MWYPSVMHCSPGQFACGVAGGEQGWQYVWMEGGGGGCVYGLAEGATEEGVCVGWVVRVCGCGWVRACMCGWVGVGVGWGEGAFTAQESQLATAPALHSLPTVGTVFARPNSFADAFRGMQKGAGAGSPDGSVLRLCVCGPWSPSAEPWVAGGGGGGKEVGRSLTEKEIVPLRPLSTVP